MIVCCNKVSGSVSCFLWGLAENRAGMSWFDRSPGEALFGKSFYVGEDV